MSKLNKVGIIVLSVPLLAGLAYSSWCVWENYQTGDWSESCGTLFTNAHYRACKQRRVWIPRLWVVASEPLPSENKIIEIHGGEALQLVSLKNPSQSRFERIPIIYLGHNQSFVLACGNLHEPGPIASELNKGYVRCP